MARYRLTISVDEELVENIDDLLEDDPHFRNISHFFEVAASELYDRIQEDER